LGILASGSVAFSGHAAGGPRPTPKLVRFKRRMRRITVAVQNAKVISDFSDIETIEKENSKE
jgi:hypothetical protein